MSTVSRTFFGLIIILTTPYIECATIFPFGSAWAYNVSGASMLGDGWNNVGYPATYWPIGTAPFGYSINAGINTALSPGPSMYYFLQNFTTGLAAGIGITATLTYVAVDGVDIFVNGQPIVSTNVPAVTCTSSTSRNTVYSANVSAGIINSGNNLNVVAAVVAVCPGSDSTGLLFDMGASYVILPSTTPSTTPTTTVTSTLSASPTQTPSDTCTITTSSSPSSTPSITVTYSSSPSVTPSTTATSSLTPSYSVTASVSASSSDTGTRSVTPTITRSPSPTLTQWNTTASSDSKLRSIEIGIGVSAGLLGVLLCSAIALCIAVMKRRSMLASESNQLESPSMIAPTVTGATFHRDSLDVLPVSQPAHHPPSRSHGGGKGHEDHSRSLSRPGYSDGVERMAHDYASRQRQRQGQYTPENHLRIPSSQHTEDESQSEWMAGGSATGSADPDVNPAPPHPMVVAALPAKAAPLEGRPHRLQSNQWLQDESGAWTSEKSLSDGVPTRAWGSDNDSTNAGAEAGWIAPVLSDGDRLPQEVSPKAYFDPNPTSAVRSYPRVTVTKPALAPAASVALETDPHKHRDRRLHRQAKPAPIPSSAPPPPQPSVLISKEFFDGGRRLPSLVQQSSTARAARSDFSDVKSHLEAVSSQSSPTRSPRKPTAMQILKGTRRDDDDLVMISSLRRSKAVTWSDQSPVSRTPRRTHRPRQHRGSPSPSSLVLSSADGSFEV